MAKKRDEWLKHHKRKAQNDVDGTIVLGALVLFGGVIVLVMKALGVV